MNLSEKIRKAIETAEQTQPFEQSEIRITSHTLPERPRPALNPYTDVLAVGFAEDSVLFGAYVNPAYRAEAMLQVSADDFSTIWRRQVWEAIMRLHRERKAVDLAGIMGLVEWHSFLAFLDSNSRVASPYQADWLVIVQQAAELRRAACAAMEGSR